MAEDTKLDDLLSRLVSEELHKRLKSSTERLAEAEKDPWDWLSLVYPDIGLKPFAPFHQEFWDEIWKVRKKVAHQGLVLDWFRGGAKSSSMELSATALLALKKRDFILYVCRNTDDAIKHVRTIQGFLESPGIQQYYPDVGNPRIGLHGNQSGWREGLLTTASGQAVYCVGLDKPIRGIKDINKRPDVIIFDDIDGLHDSSEMTRKILEIITKSVIPARALDGSCLFMFGQNEIRKTSIMSQVMRGDIGLLAMAKKIGPIKGFTDFDYELDPEIPGRAIITKGIPNWPEGYTIEMAQADVDVMGIDAFLTEVQQEVDYLASGAVYPNWDEKIHIITRDEFQAYFGDVATDEYGNPKIPDRWDLLFSQDWGTTVQHPCVSGWFGKPSRSFMVDFDGLEDGWFMYREMWTPKTKEEERGGEWDAIKIGTEILARETPAETARLKGSRIMSHEARGPRMLYLNQLGLSVGAVKPTKVYGIEAVRFMLMPDKTRPHPFRKYPLDCPLTDQNGEPLAGKPLMGRPKLYFIVENGQGELYWNHTTNKLEVKQPKDEGGLIRTRREFPEYHWDETQIGEQQKVPYDLFQDAMDMIRYRLGNLDGIIHQRPAMVEARHQLYEFNKNLTQNEPLETLDSMEKAGVYAAQNVEFNKLLEKVTKERVLGGNSLSTRRKNRSGIAKRFKGSATIR